MRALKSSDVVGGVVCSQVAPQVLDGIIGDDAARYTPGSEIVAVVDSRGKRHVVETQSAQRGRRVERIHKVLEGPGLVTEVVDGHEFSFPPTAFWQAHLNAAQTYSDLIKEWGSDNYTHRNGWDLYGGVGAFVPAINEAIGGRIDSVDYSASATANPQPVEDEFDVHRHNAKVEVGISELPAPGLVVLDPPGQGQGVMSSTRLRKRLQNASFTSVVIQQPLRATSQALARTDLESSTSLLSMLFPILTILRSWHHLCLTTMVVRRNRVNQFRSVS
ncbi:hypothetical protein SAMN04488531_0016 [Corynebacterium coyleae]|uniref:hypothetical protein n=1 Tax=Corynebacterium coyleae TaxID=53374 RepID=UPI00089AAEC5|nr:hypothetical protein SAMN04488531_0016 [Corynebacterium coyleae]